jgi:hypothetical protein
MARTYSPLPSWPIGAVVMGTFLCTSGPLLPVAAGLAGYVVGPLVARALMSLPNTLAEFPDEPTTHQEHTWPA